MSRVNRLKAKARRERKRAAQLEKERLLELESEEADDQDEVSVVNNYNLTINSAKGEDELIEDFKVLKTLSEEELPDADIDESEEDPEEVEDLVNNIVNLKEVGDRVSAIVNEPMERELDMDVLAIEAIIAQDSRNTNLPEKLMDFIAKKKLSTSAREKLDDSSFALPEKRKYPIHDKAHVRNALSRAAQLIKDGGEGAEDARKALPQIRAAAKKMGIETSMEKDKNAIIIEKDAKGDWRAVMWVSNNFIDWDRDIIAESAHKEYVGWLDENPDMAPAFISWHIPETVRKNRVDFWAYENGFLIMSAKLEEGEAAALMKAKAATDIGMSHGSLVFERDEKDPRVILKYRMYEVSDLPLTKAANPFTDFETVVKEVDMEKLEYLTTILGDEETAKAFVEKTDAKQKVLRDAQVEEKAKDETPVEEVEQPEAQAITPEISAEIEKVLKENFDIDGLADWVKSAQEALEKVPVLEELVKDMAIGHEEKLAEMISPKPRLPWSKAASQSEENIVKENDPEDKKLVDSVPGVPEDYWLSKATNTAPIKGEVQ